MAHPNLSPSFSTASHASLHAPLSPSRSDYPKPAPRRSPRRPHKLLSSPTTSSPYEHFSALRSTHEPQPRDMFEPVCNGPDDCGFANSEFECKECARVCEDASCAVEFTSQCTDQCVVVACNDAHHGSSTSSCDDLAAPPQCSKQCSGEFDCSEFEQFVSPSRRRGCNHSVQGPYSLLCISSFSAAWTINLTMGTTGRTYLEMGIIPSWRTPPSIPSLLDVRRPTSNNRPEMHQHSHRLTPRPRRPSWLLVRLRHSLIRIWATPCRRPAQVLCPHRRCSHK